MATLEQAQQLVHDGRVIDVHVNVGHRDGDHIVDGDMQREHVFRQFTADDLQQTPLRCIGLRTHYSHVDVPAGSETRFVPSVALNWTGVDPERVERELQRFAHPHPILWFQSFRDPYHRQVMDSAYRGIIAAGGEEEGIVTHTDDLCRLTRETLNVLEIARDRGAVIATPHANWERTSPLIIQAVDMGLSVLWVHPDSRLIRTPLAIQQALAACGTGQKGKGRVFVERAAVFLRDGKAGVYSAEQVVADVRAIGMEHIIFSSDLGRPKATDPLLPHEGLLWYIERLIDAGLTFAEVSQGFVENPGVFIEGSML